MKMILSLGFIISAVLLSGCGQEEPKAPLDAKEAKIQAALGKLDPQDRKLAVEQKFCAVMGKSRLGSMGPPIKIMIEGQAVFVCCEQCQEKADSEPAKALAAAKNLKSKAK